MKKLIVAAAALVWSGAAFAGDYHQSTTLRCSECHTMHASRAHGMNGQAADVGWVAPAFPNDKLLIQSGVNTTCLACHDGQGTVPDVFGANGSTFAANARSAGALNGSAGAHVDASYSTWMGHTLGSPDSPPGFTASWDPSAEGFHCGNCHAIHGSPKFRNLGGINRVGTAAQKLANAFAGIGPAYNQLQDGAATRDAPAATDDVFVTNNTAKTYLTTEVEFRTGGAGGGGMNKYCAVCHGDFHNTAGSDANTKATNNVDFIRHPTTGVALGTASQTTTFATLAANTEAIKLVRPAYSDGTKTAAEAACLSCHKGHGNLNGFGLVYPAANNGSNAGAYEQGAGGTNIRFLCVTCHPY